MGDIPWANLLTGLVGGVALFLLGIQQLTRALQSVASERLRALLLRLSGTPLRGALSGVAATGVIQSSTATVLLIVGFTAAGAMTLSQAVAVVLGANVGTTITVQIIAFDVTRFALLMIAAGVAVTMVGRMAPVHGPARVMLALGLLFFGMQVMADAISPLRDAPELATTFTGDLRLGVAVLAGAAVTAVIQSSSATSGILIVLASQGLLDLETGIAALLGAAIGTCVTPLIAGLASERAGLRVAVVHVAINAVAVGVWIWLIPQLAAVAVAVSPASPELAGTARLAAETPRQLANAYTIFKVVNLMILIGFTGRIAALTERFLPDRPRDDRLGAVHLDQEVLETPLLALELAERELERLGQEVVGMVAEVGDVVLHGSAEQLGALAERDQRVDAIYRDLLDYLGAIGQQELTRQQGQELLNTMAMANDLETIGDIIENNLVPLGHRLLAEGLILAPSASTAIAEFHAAVADDLRRALLALRYADPELARTIVEGKREIMDRRDVAIARLAQQLRSTEPNRVSAYERAVELVGHLQRVAGLTRHLARNVTGPRVRDAPPG